MPSIGSSVKSSFLLVLSFAALAALSLEGAAPLKPLRVVDGKVCADGKPIVLRGLNWGWWHLSGTVYTENEARRQAEWGANLIRLAFSYGDVESAARDGTLREDGVRDVDEVIGWAAKYGQYVILDMHVCPGGQDPQHYCDGGKNLLWKDESCRRRFLALWRNLAARYRDNPTVAAYELMNEPCSQRPDPALVADICRRAVPEIRKADPDKMIVMTGDAWSNAKDLRDEIKLDDDNVLYTFHFYEGGEDVRWLRNESAGRDAKTGTGDWTRFDVPVDIRTTDRSFSVLLRSDANSGAAWFDDVEVVNAGGQVVRRFEFNRNPEGFRPERAPKTAMAYDPEVGHDGKGSLKIAGTPEYNGWIFDQFKSYALPGTFRIRGWMKLENATGKTYACAAVRGIASPNIDVKDLDRLISVAVAFGKRHNVPLWVGEFSAAKDSGPDGFQLNSVRERIRLFERYGLHWTYWNFREPTSPNGMGLHTMKRNRGGDNPINEPLLKLLSDGFKGRVR